MTKKTISVLGGGSWGTVLANLAAKNDNEVFLWMRDSETCKSINEEKINLKYLPKYSLEENKREAILLAKEALSKNPKYVSKNHQKEQLWGAKLIDATQRLFKDQEMTGSVEQAKVKNTTKNSS